MKQSLFYRGLVALFSKLVLNKPYVLDGFHLDFFLSLYQSLKVPCLILLPDNLFAQSLKYLSYLQTDRCVVFIPPNGCDADVPGGFVGVNTFHYKRSKDILSSGLSDVLFIICAESGFSVQIVGSDSSNEINFSSNIDFDDCLDFLTRNGYSSVDVVVRPGEFCVRGGIIDVYPFSSENPVRVSFLDSVLDIYYFDIQSQLTTKKINDFSITVPQKLGLNSLKDSSLSDFIHLIYNQDDLVNVCVSPPVGFSNVFRCISFNDFINLGEEKNSCVVVDQNLSSVGIIDHVNNIIVPGWFVNAPPPLAVSSEGAHSVPLNITNIKKGDYLVHRDHGIGAYVGLHRDGGGLVPVQEFISIKYKDGGVIRLNTCRLDLVDYYASRDFDGVVLDSLNKRAVWSRRKRAAMRHAEETVEHLLNMYVRRNEVSRAAFSVHSKMEDHFLDDFPYRDTDDQASAWNEISDDLSSESPMDRLLCGDVGFGKTEIAMRAAFRVVLSGCRVLVLAPTTILANQLFVSFAARLGSHAVNVDIISRFRSAKNILDIKKKIDQGKNDVLVGTHSVLNDDIYLKNIGLLVIDEEHRFGVRQKEVIKGVKGSVDVLSMSATPIPRSLNLALLGIYSVSLLQTPPLMRLPIITHVDCYDDKLIRDAVFFEIERGGQVYFVHNNIQDIEAITHRLRNLLSGLQIISLHGKESSREIEKKMNLFISVKAHVLVCTSIIEVGIDVPNANCIIINNAHLFGLSQLYQIRGRVGRSYRQAYAYLLLPRGFSLSDKAFDRIKTIEENTRLGSGYNISRSDMSLRGAGSLFGYKQSGGGGFVGYEMYLRLIRRALHVSGKLRGEYVVLPEDVLIDIFERRYIPENYISFEGLRLSFYKNLVSATSLDELDNILYHMKNRFGSPPLPVNNLFDEYRLRLMAAAAGFKSIQVIGCGVVCKMIQNDNPALVSAVLEYLKLFCDKRCIDFHLLPCSVSELSICLHVSEKIDKYSLLSSFLNKFKTLDYSIIGRC